MHAKSSFEKISIKLQIHNRKANFSLKESFDFPLPASAKRLKYSMDFQTEKIIKPLFRFKQSFIKLAVNCAVLIFKL